MTPITQEKFIIQGLAGEALLRGKIHVNGAKNSALKAMAAAILFDGPVLLKNIPETADVATMIQVLEKLGVKVSRRSGGDSAGRGEARGEKLDDRRGEMTIDASGMRSTDIDKDLAKSMRASVVLTGPLLARFGHATFPAPGGCVIGARPIDLFLEGYKMMGARAELDEKAGKYRIDEQDGLNGADIFFNIQAVGPTETLMMAAALAHGTTILKNCAMEPEIGNVAEWLIAGGARISGVGTPTITIQGTGGKLLSAKSVEQHPYVAIPDRIEAGSFLILGALCASELSIEACEPAHLESLISLLRGAGVEVTCGKDSIKVKRPANADKSSKTADLAKFGSFNVRTHEYPGFPTDLQAPLVTFLTQAEGESKVVETIFEGRFKYVEELQKMGADITIMNPREIMIKGPAALKELPDDEELTAHDIRAGFAIVLAALAGKGRFVVNNIHLIDRGYEKLEERLSSIGAKIERK